MNPAPPGPPGGDGDDQKRMLMAVALCAGIIFLWQVLFPPPPPVKQPVPDAAVAEQGEQPAQKAAQPAPDAPVVPVIERRTVATLAEKGRHQLSLTNEDGQIGTWTLTEEQYGVGEKREPFVFVAPLTADHNLGVFLPPRLELSLGGKRAIGEYQVVRQDSKSAELRWEDPARGVAVTRSYTLNPDDYTVDAKITVTNTGAAPLDYDLSAHLRGAQNDEEATGSLFSPPIYLFETVCQRAEDFERMPVQTLVDATAEGDPTRFTDARWAGVDNRYFMTAVMADVNEVEACHMRPGRKAADAPEVKVEYPVSYLSTQLELTGGQIAPGASVTRSVSFYGGPKKLDVLAAQKPALDAAIDFGWFTSICTPMLWAMRMFYGWFGNWGWAIILLTVVVKLLTFPLTHKQYKSMAAMKILQPEMKALQERYKDDKAKLQQEMMALYREHKVNPLAGCLPMLLMMPIYFSLYRTIYSAVELYQAEFGWWIKDLSAQDPTYILPIVLGVLMILQMRLNPSAGGDQMQQKIIMWVMPIMFTGMMLFLPSGLVVYILVNTVLGIVQQTYLLKNAAAPAASAPVKKKAGAKA